MSALLEVRGLRKEFRARSAWRPGTTGRLVAVDGVDLDLKAGETLALVGESGSGKTTLGRAALRLIEPTAGSVRFRGEELLDLGPTELRRRRKSFQMVFQDPYLSLNPRMRIGDAVFEPQLIHGLARRRDRAGTVAPLLAEVGLGSDLIDRYPHELSGGQRQRVGIARALASSPDLLVADEPVSALDASMKAQVVHLLGDLQRRRRLALLFIAHDLALVDRIADRVAVLHAGRVVEHGPTREVIDRPRHPYTGALLASVLSPVPGGGARRTPVGAIAADTGAAPGGCPFRPRCPIAETRCRVERPALRPIVAAAGVEVACHRPGEPGPDDPVPGMEPFARRDVMNDNAESGANQRGYEA